MWLNISTQSSSAARITYLLHKHPATIHIKEWSQIKAWLYFHSNQPEALSWTLFLKTIADKNSAVANPLSPSHCSIALNKYFSSAMNGVSDEADDLVDLPFLWTVQYGTTCNRQFKLILEKWLKEVPGYKHFSSLNGILEFQIMCPLRILLKMIYVFFIAADQKNHLVTQLNSRNILIEKGKEWLDVHPDQKMIQNLFLKNESLQEIPHALLQEIFTLTPNSKWFIVGGLENAETPMIVNQENIYTSEHPLQHHLDKSIIGNLFVWQSGMEQCTDLLFVIKIDARLDFINILARYQWWSKQEWNKIYVLSEKNLPPGILPLGKNWQLSKVLEKSPYTLYLLNDQYHAA